MGAKLYPHQEDAVKRLSNGKILWGGVGSGKSLAAAAYYVRNESPRDIVVITTAKKRDDLDWNREFVKFGIGRTRDATCGGVLTVDSWNNIHKYTERRDCFFIFDEQRLVGSGAWAKAFRTIVKHNRWILLSATPGDTWLDYVQVFIANGLYRNITEFKREHVIYEPYVKYPKVKGYLNTDVLEKYRDILLVEMPYARTTTRHSETVYLPYDEELMRRAFKDRWNVFTHEPIVDVAELFRVMRKIVAIHPSRIEKIRELLGKHPKIIIFYSFNYELEILRTLEDQTTVGEWNGHKKTPIPDTDSWVYLVQYVAGSEGWNCVETDAMVFYSAPYSWKNFSQAHGRIDRLDTKFKDLYYYVLTSKSMIDQAVRRALDKKEMFNEREYAKKGFPEGDD